MRGAIFFICAIAIALGEQINDDPRRAREICSAPGSDGVLVAHEYCSCFYKCSEGLPVTMNCPQGLFYLPERKWCDYPEKVNCDTRL